MKKKTLAAFAAFLVIAIGTSAIYLLGREPSASIEPAASVIQPEEAASQTAEDLAVANAEQAKEIDRLRQEVERLSSEPKEQAESGPSEATAPVSSEAIPVSAPPAPDPISAPPAAADNPSPPPVSTPKENAGTVFEGYTVTVTDSKTPAVRSAGNDWPITKYYFIDDDGNYLGSISGKAMNAIIEKYQDKSTGEAPGAGGEWEFWFAEGFNNYRGIGSTYYNEAQSKNNPQPSSEEQVDTDAYAEEVIRLINQKREKVGLDALEVDSSLMSHSEVRAEELSIQYSHVRPDGTKEKSECIVMRRDTPAAAVQSWMDSDPHRDAILDESGRFPYQYIGSGCYQDEKGVLYWVITFGL